MKKAIFAALAILGATAAVPATAQQIGDTINGTLAFGSNGANGGNYWNQKSIVAPGSFTYADGSNIDTATFGLNTLTITDNVLSNANGFKMTFTDVTNPFTGFSLLSSTFSPGLTYSFSAGTLNVNWTGTSTSGLQTAVFTTSTTGAVPEPATWALMILGMGAVGFAMRRAKRTSDAKFDAKIKRIAAGALA